MSPRPGTADALRRARTLITPAWRFTREASAMSRLARPTLVDHPDAVSFDPLGAMERACGDDDDLGASCFEYLLRANGVAMADFAAYCRSPDRTHAEHLAAFDRAARMAEADGL